MPAVRHCALEQAAQTDAEAAASQRFEFHLQGDATTTTILIRFDPATPGFSSYGATLLDRNVVYDDGVSEVEYLAPIGMQPPSLMGDAALDAGLDTTEHLLPEFDFPISEEDIRAGAYDFAKYTAYLVNYEDLDNLMVTTIGAAPFLHDGEQKVVVHAGGSVFGASASPRTTRNASVRASSCKPPSSGPHATTPSTCVGA